MGCLRCSWDRKHDTRSLQQPRERNLQSRRVEVSGCGFQGLLSEPVLTKRRPRNEGDPVPLAVIEKEIPLAVGKAVSVLHGYDRNDLQSTFYMLQGHVRQRKVTDLSLLLKTSQRLH